MKELFLDLTNQLNLYFERRTETINNEINLNVSALDFTKIKKDDIGIAKVALEQISLNFFTEKFFQIINIITSLFVKNYVNIDLLLASNKNCKRAIKKYNQILFTKNSEYKKFSDHRISKSTCPSDPGVKNPAQAGFFQIQKYQFIKLKNKLNKLKTNLADQSKSKDEHLEFFAKSSNYITKTLISLSNLYEIENAKENPSLLSQQFQIDEKNHKSLIEILDDFLSSYIENYSQLIEIEKNEGFENFQKNKSNLIKLIESNDKFFVNLSQKTNLNSSRCIFDTSIDRLTDHISDSILKEPIRVTMVGAEYAGLVKVGGLAEAIEGLSRGLKEQNPNNQINLIFPKYSCLPKEINRTLTDFKTHLSKKGEEYKVYECEINGITCQFIEHSSFDLKDSKLSIYSSGNDTDSESNTDSVDNKKLPTKYSIPLGKYDSGECFTEFSELAADLIYKEKKTDVIHLHDWHVSGIAQKLKNDHLKEWENGDIPPIVFTYHNNQQSNQGRINLGPYNYESVLTSYHRHGIVTNNENLFVNTLMTVDGVTTVSENFSRESQQVSQGKGVSFAVRQAAKVGKLAGIINGGNPHRWNPETDPALKKWKDVKKPWVNLDLSYGPESNDLLEKKELCKTQLKNWVHKNFPYVVNFDCTKPLVTFIGRFDSYQKGLDKLEEAIQTTIKNGGQFICMGSSEDRQASQILDDLEKKYQHSVLFIRDFKDHHTRFHYQEEMGLGPLIRAATDFIFIPSLFEPCGLIQFEGWLFGSLAIGSDTGGLADTIIPREKDAKNYNGFLFQREGDKENSAEKVIERALTFWKGTNNQQKQDIIKRLINQGKKYGWSTAPVGFSPAAKYRFVYENARRRIKYRKENPKSFNRIEALKQCSILKSKPEKCSDAENYLNHYYNKNLTSESLEPLYQKIPKKERATVPSPYGIGVDYTKYQKYGSFYGEAGTSFAVFAPNANKVSIVLTSDDESDQTEHTMEKQDSRDWKLTLPVKPGQKYQYKINEIIKQDPYGLSHYPSKYEGKAPFSVVVNSLHQWGDDEWMNKRSEQAAKSKPISIYEMLPTCWKKKDGAFLNYRELAHDIADHCKKMNYTHVQLMGILEHPNEASWGYQVTGYFAPNSRLGSVDDFKFMINYLHNNNIGVILDWVPAHFAKDEFGLQEFDGTNLYEASGIKYFFTIRNLFFKYGSKHFDFQKREVREFLISSAHYWLKEMHLDGLRVDCVTSLLLTENKASADLFMRDLNGVVHRHLFGALTTAEEFTGDTRTTSSPYLNGLDFDLKHHAGWISYIYDYFSFPIRSRRKKYHDVYKAIMSDHFNKQIMFFCHDDVKSKYKSLITQTPEIKSLNKKYANVRVMLSFMMCLPGKKLHCMGTEFGHEEPWDNYVGKNKGILDEDMSIPGSKVAEMISKLNGIYRKEKAFYERDANGRDLEWLEDDNQRVHAYRRKSSTGDSFSCFHNFTGEKVQEFKVTVKKPGKGKIAPQEIFNSDDDAFGGKGRLNQLIKIEENDEEVNYTIQVPPLTTIIVKEI